MSWIDFGLTLGGLPVMVASLYLSALALLARRTLAQTSATRRLRFDVVVPAHDEESVIGTTVESLMALDYPRDRFRVRVVADNCHDRTAERAAAAGAHVIIRTNEQQRGKGHALADAFHLSLAEGFADAIVVIDADTVVSSNLLSAFAARFEAGAAAVQADYGVRNPQASWRTRLMTIALAAFHGVRSLARERLGLSCGLRGNGMGFSRDALRTVHYSAFSIVEDLGYGIALGYAGVRVEYVDEARVLGEMVAGEKASRSQRRRWEGGRRTLVRQHAVNLVIQACRRSDVILFDLALDLLVPPLGELVAVCAGGLALSLLITRAGNGVAVWAWAASLIGLIVYVMRGWQLSGVGATGLVDLLWAPVYVTWKLMLRLRHLGQKPKEWTRTSREVGT